MCMTKTRSKLKKKTPLLRDFGIMLAIAFLFDKFCKKIGSYAMNEKNWDFFCLIHEQPFLTNV